MHSPQWARHFIRTLSLRSQSHALERQKKLDSMFLHGGGLIGG